MMDTRPLYVAGYVLGLLGALVTSASQINAGFATVGIISLGTTVTFVLGLRSVYTTEEFDREHGPAYRIGNWVRAVLVLATGLLMVAIGVGSVGLFG